MKLLTRLIYEYRLGKIKANFNKSKLQKKAIIISGSPRGGTTWLFEVLQKTAPVFGLWEPLHPIMINEYYPKKSFTFHKYISQEIKSNELIPYLEDLTKGNHITTRLLQKNTKFKSYKKQELLLLKFCRLSPILPWFNKNFNDHKILQLYRNPLAVVSSQMKHGAWNTFSKKNINKLINKHNYNPEYYAQFQDIFDLISYPEEVLATVWALDMIPTINYEDKNILKLKYEDVFLEPQENFLKIYNHYSLPLPSNLEAIINKPSSTTKVGSNILTEPKLQLETWKKHLNEAQANRVKLILSKFGFNHIQDIDYSLKIDRKIKL